MNRVYLFYFIFPIFISHYSDIYFFFFISKGGRVTPLYVAAELGHLRIVQTLLEKGRANPDLVTKVIFLIVSFSYSIIFSSSFFLNFFFGGGSNSSLYCCSRRLCPNSSNFIGKRKSKCWSCWRGFLICCLFLFIFLFFHYFYFFIIFIFLLFFFFFFSFSFFLFFECKEWSNSSLYGCSRRTCTNCSTFIGKRKSGC